MRALVATMIAALLLVNVSGASADEHGRATLYKNPNCGCCDSYANYLRDNGFEVTVKPTHDLALLKQRYGVPEELAGCHTTLIDGYVIEGHVPVDTLKRFLAERPDVTGISLPGMPQGSPGMTGRKDEPFTIYEFNEGTARVYAIQ